MTNENPELKKQQSISAAEHPKAWDPQVMILGLPLAVVGCIIGLELIVRTGGNPEHLHHRSTVFHSSFQNSGGIFKKIP